MYLHREITKGHTRIVCEITVVFCQLVLFVWLESCPVLLVVYNLYVLVNFITFILLAFCVIFNYFSLLCNFKIKYQHWKGLFTKNNCRLAAGCCTVLQTIVWSINTIIIGVYLPVSKRLKGQPSDTWYLLHWQWISLTYNYLPAT